MERERKKEKEREKERKNEKNSQQKNSCKVELLKVKSRWRDCHHVSMVPQKFFDTVERDRKKEKRRKKKR